MTKYELMERVKDLYHANICDILRCIDKIADDIKYEYYYYVDENTIIVAKSIIGEYHVYYLNVVNNIIECKKILRIPDLFEYIKSTFNTDVKIYIETKPEEANDFIYMFDKIGFKNIEYIKV